MVTIVKGRLLPPGFDAHLGDLSWGHFGIKMHKPVMIHDLHHVSDVFDLCHGVYAMLSPYRPHPQVPLGMPGTGSCAIYLIQKKALLCTGPLGLPGVLSKDGAIQCHRLVVCMLMVFDSCKHDALVASDS